MGGGLDGTEPTPDEGLGAELVGAVGPEAGPAGIDVGRRPPGGVEGVDVGDREPLVHRIGLRAADLAGRREHQVARPEGHREQHADGKEVERDRHPGPAPLTHHAGNAQQPDSLAATLRRGSHDPRYWLECSTDGFGG